MGKINITKIEMETNIPAAKIEIDLYGGTTLSIMSNNDNRKNSLEVAKRNYKKNSNDDIIYLEAKQKSEKVASIYVSLNIAQVEELIANLQGMVNYIKN